MCRASVTGGILLATLLLALAAVLSVAGCGGGGDEDRVPAFEDTGISDKSYVQNLAIDGETLPAASGGDGTLTYALSPELPPGLVFDPQTRRLSGTPAAAHPATLYAYTATDGDASGPDTATLTFTLTVHEDLVPVFERVGIADKVYERGLSIDGETLPAASGGDGALTYALSPELPPGLVFDPATRRLSGTPAAAHPATLYAYTATDGDASGPDTATLTFTLTVHEDLVPVFERVSIADKVYERGLSIDGETLPAASGGDGALTYALSPELPPGLVFDPATRRLSGTPAAVHPATLYAYTATDGDAVEPDTATLTFTLTVEATATVIISTAAGEVDEGDDRTPVAVTLTLSEPVLGDVAVALRSTGTALLGSDFDLAGTEVVVPAGSTRATTTITPIRDLEAEGDETVRLEIDSIVGRGEIGPASSIDVVVRDLGGPPQGEYAAFLAFFTTFDAIEEDAVTLTFVVFNNGVAGASPTRASMLTVAPGAPQTTLASLPVQALQPKDWFVASVRVPFDELVPGVNNFFILRVAPVPEEDPDLLAADEGGAVGYEAVFLTDEGRIPVTCAGFARDTEPGTEDPLFAQQWSLDNTGQMSFAAEGGAAGHDLNMRQARAEGLTGAGVRVAVVDTGLEICHPDLAASVEPGRSFNFNAPIWLGAGSRDPFPANVLGDHGTSVAGLIAATADNGVGGRGVAPGSRLRGFNFLAVPDQGLAYFDALGMSSARPRSDDVHVFNMSFGSIGRARDVSADESELFWSGVTDLRNGLGAIYVKTAGNEFNDCTRLDDDRRPVAPLLDLSAELGCFAANQDGLNNLPYVIVTGGFSANGRRSSYSSAGANLWAVAPAGEYGVDRPAMITTDQMGVDRGYGLYGIGLAADAEANPLGDYTSIFNGTSAAAPNASGAVALLLETQPRLTWRDVKHILARTARRLHADIPPVRVAFGGVPAVLQHGWITNAAGYRFHNWYGFGAIDVDAAVALAAAHDPDSLGVFTESAPIRLATGIAIPDHDGGGLMQTQNVTGLSRTANVEAVQLRIEVTHGNPRELGFELTSPAGTRSVVNPVFNHALNSADNPLDWTILSNAFYGEPPIGEWTLNVIDVAAGNTGILDAWSLIFYLGEHPENP